MAWNQPGNNGQDRDPWGAAVIKAATLGKSGRPRSGTSDLDDIFRKLSKKLGGLGGGKQNDNGQQSSGGSGGKIVGIVVVAAVVIWAASGFYTIRKLNGAW